MDAMLVEKDKRLAEKEDYIIHLQMALGGAKSDKTAEQVTPQSKVRKNSLLFYDIDKLALITI